MPRLVAIRLAALMCCLAALASLAQQPTPLPFPRPQLKPGFPAEPQPPGSTSAPGTYNQQAARALGFQASLAVMNGDFNKAESIYADLVEKMPRATDGTWVIEGFQETFDAQFSVRSDEETKRSMQPWQRDRPQSTALAIVEAIMWQRRAWVARGNGYMSTVQAEGMQIFQERLLLAAQALERSGEAGKRSPVWYWVSLTVDGSSGLPAPEFDARFEEAAKRFPNYQPIYYVRLNYLLPKWGGSYEAVDDFVEAAVDRTRATEGEAMYAWLYAAIVKSVDGNLFELTKASWPRMKQGFEDMLKRYPDPDNRAFYAAHACVARDRETTARLLVLLGAQADFDRFVTGVSTEACRRFAMSPA